MERTARPANHGAAEPSVSRPARAAVGGSPTESLCVRSFQLQRAVATGRPASLSRCSSLPSPGQTDERRVRGPRSCRRCPGAFAECGADAGQSFSVSTLPRARCGAFEPTDRAGHSLRPAAVLVVRSKRHYALYF